MQGFPRVNHLYGYFTSSKRAKSALYTHQAACGVIREAPAREGLNSHGLCNEMIASKH
jgi:hypothetical protein